MWQPTIDELFSHGARHRWADGDDSKLDVVRTPDVVLPTGRLVVCDPGYTAYGSRLHKKYLAATVNPGAYPVQVAVVDTVSERAALPPRRPVTAARVFISHAEVASWEPAWPLKEPAADGNVVGGFGVDAGMGCFMDESIAPFLDNYQTGEGGGARGRALGEQVIKNGWTVIADDESGANVVIFDCGMGDGSYPVWLGKAADGSLAQVAADLELLSHSDGPVR